MDILLLFPPSIEDSEMEMPPLGLGVLRTKLAKEGYDSDMKDLFAETRARNIGNIHEVTYEHMLKKKKRFLILYVGKVKTPSENILIY